MTARIRQALMIRPWQGIMIVGIVAAFGVFLFSGPGARYEWAAVILFGLVTILQLGKVQAAPPGSQERYDRVALGAIRFR